VIVSVEGNIGSGKSSLLHFIKARFRNIHIIPEPIEEWTMLDNVNPLHEMYANAKYSTLFQMLTIHSHMKMMKVAKQCGKDCIVERCWESNKDIFTNMLIEGGKIDSVENAIYNHILKDRLSEIGGIKPHGYIYVKTHVDQCVKRIRNRNRSEETGISKEYLAEIEKRQEHFLRKQETSSVLTIDNNSEKHTIRDYKEIFSKIKSFVDTLKDRNG
jgi:deoxyadenosine/deoxycytidine kinase